MRAEEGSGPVRTLMIGGPKHGEWMNFHPDQDSYEFVEPQVLAGVAYSANDDRYQGNVYTRDIGLSMDLGKLVDHKFEQQVFVHSVIARGDHGSGILPALTRAQRALDERDAQLGSRSKTISEQAARIDELEERVGELLEERDEAVERLYGVRQLLEIIALSVGAAVHGTNLDYRPQYKQ